MAVARIVFRCRLVRQNSVYTQRQSGIGTTASPSPEEVVNLRHPVVKLRFAQKCVIYDTE